MDTAIILTLCVLLLLAYVFDITSSKTRIPSVILLLVLGYVVRQITTSFKTDIPDLSPVLPLLGTVGLILIVLEGSLELHLNKEKLPFAMKSSLMALLPMLLISFLLGHAFYYFSEGDYQAGLANAIPFAVISSAIAIPTASILASKDREFITYESSFSDIFGVIFFNFITLNDNIGTSSFGFFFMEILVILVVSFVGTAALAFLLGNIRHRIKFVPIILMVVLIYFVSKIYHLPALIFILLFGLFLGNLDELNGFSIIHRLKPDILKNEVKKFRELTTEFAFLIRALFFLVFGYLIEAHEMFNAGTIIWAVCIVAAIFILRFIFLKILKFKINPLIYLAPRGLITILLFLSIPAQQHISLVNKSLIIQVILLTALVMMMGMITYRKEKESTAIHTDNHSVTSSSYDSDADGTELQTP